MNEGERYTRNKCTKESRNFAPKTLRVSSVRDDIETAWSQFNPRSWVRHQARKQAGVMRETVSTGEWRKNFQRKEKPHFCEGGKAKDVYTVRYAEEKVFIKSTCKNCERPVVLCDVLVVMVYSVQKEREEREATEDRRKPDGVRKQAFNCLSEVL